MQVKQWIIHKLGGYASIEEALEAAPQETLNKAVAKLFCFVSKDDILRKEGVEFMYKGRPLTQEEVKQLVNEAKYMRKLRLWEVIKKELYYHGSKKMYFDSQSINDVTWAKLLFFVTDVIESKLKSLEKLRDKV